VIRLVFFCAAAHFALAFIMGALSQGLDFDQLRNRSVVSRAATPVADFLMAPHGAVIRAMPNRWLTQRHFPVIPIWLVTHSLLWGAAIASIILGVRQRRFA
jgi:hypothetical protein